jgi:hypothetical protein
VTHAELVRRAVRWLRNSRRCNVVLAEAQCYWVREFPDAIGWRGSSSILIECKTSITDFYADRRKPSSPHRMGVYRYYLTPPGLLQPEQLPTGWGLLEAEPRCLRRRRKASAQPDYNYKGEIALLVMEVAKLVGGLRRERDRTGSLLELDASPELTDVLPETLPASALATEGG